MLNVAGLCWRRRRGGSLQGGVGCGCVGGDEEDGDIGTVVGGVRAAVVVFNVWPVVCLGHLLEMGVRCEE